MSLRNIAAILLLSATVIEPLHSQSFGDHPTMHVGIRYTTYSLGDATTLFRSVLSFYQANAIPMKETRAFPSALPVHAGLDVPIHSNLRIGLSADHGVSSAAATYADASGSGNVRSEVRVTGTELTVELVTSPEARVRPFLRSGIGVVSATYQLSQRLYTPDGTLSYESFVRAAGSSFRWSGATGVVLDAEPVRLVFFVGLHLGSIESLTGRSQQNGSVVSNGTLPLTIGLHGAELGLEIGFAL